MITKVSYNAYASSANSIKSDNQKQNVNFGTLRTTVLENLPSHVLTDFRNLRDYFINDSLMVPAVATHRVSTPDIYPDAEIPKLDILTRFLDFCGQNPKAQSDNIFRWLNETPISQKEPNATNVMMGHFSIGQIIAFCRKNPGLTAEQILAGMTEDMSLETMKVILNSLRT